MLKKDFKNYPFTSKTKVKVDFNGYKKDKWYLVETIDYFSCIITLVEDCDSEDGCFEIYPDISYTQIIDIK